MERRLKILAVLVLILIITIPASAWHVHTLYTLEREANVAELDLVEFRFETVQGEGIEIVDVEAQKYSDITFLDLEVIASKKGDRELTLKNPVIAFYLEDLFILNKTLDDIELSSGESWSMRFNELTFKTEVVENATLGRRNRADETFIISGEVTAEYTFVRYDYVLQTYRLSSSFVGRIPLQEVFGGKTKEDAVDKILNLGGFTGAEEGGEEPKRPTISLPM